MSESGIFKIAVKLPPPEQAAYLDQACGNDSALRQEIESLLMAHEAADKLPGRFVDRGAMTEVTERMTEQAGMIIGRYKLLQAVGEGGMGTVWVAQQNEPVRRRVALKLVKAGMDSRQVLSRFEVERQALALMDHPNIAKVLDGGATERGRPFFVMEYVKGVPITQFCDEARLTVQERLRLFVQVCQAVQHAHQKGIVHRDLKPSNILVCLYDGKPVPKVIDFGLAKAMHQPLTEHTLYTAHGLMVGTPLYMSPEQAEFNNLDIDTRTDVYSLGVILYELLTGTTPLDRKRFNDAAWQEILRVIKEDEPSKPSTKLTGSEALPTIAAQRSLEPAQLSRLMRGDLDWIVMKALEKERSRRYETANGFARDLERYLSDQPVEACPPSATYRFRKFARRNRMALTSVALIAMALVGGIVTSTWLAVRARRAEGRAQFARDQEAREREAAEDAREEAQQQRAAAVANLQKARAAVDKYFTLVSESTLFDVPGLQPLRGKLLEAALEFYRSQANETANDPAALAELAAAYMRFAEISHVNDRNDDAIAALGKANDLIGRLRREFPQAREQTRKLAGFWKGYRREFAFTDMPKDPQAAFVIINRVAETWQALAQEHPDDPAFRSDLAAILYHLGDLLCSAKKHAQGIGHLERSLAVQEQLVRDFPRESEYRADLARSLEKLAENFRAIGKKGEADSSSRKALAIREQLVAERPDVPQHQVELASTLEGFAGALIGHDNRQAEKLLRREVELTERLASEQSHAPAYLRRWSLAQAKLLCILTIEARTKDSEELVQSATEFIQRVAGLHPDTPSPQLYLANLYHSSAFELNVRRLYYPAQIAFWKRGIALREGCLADPAYPEDDLQQLGHAYRMVGGRENHAKAANVFARLAAAHPAKADYYRDFEFDSSGRVAHDLIDASKFGEAEQWLKRAAAIHGDAPRLHLERARILESQKKLHEALAEIRRVMPSPSWDYEFYDYLSNLLKHLGDKQQTLAVMRECVAAAPKSNNAHCFLAFVLSEQGRSEEAVAEFRTSIELYSAWEWPRLGLAEELLKLNKPDAALAATRAIVVPEDKGWYSRFWLGRLWARQGHAEEAVKYLLQAAKLESESTMAFAGLRDLIDQFAGKPGQQAMIATVDQGLANTRYSIEWNAICGRWNEAAASLQKRIAETPDDHFLWYRAAFLLAMQGDVAKYRAHCSKMLERFNDAQDPFVAERVCKSCLVLEAPAAELAKLRELGHRSVTNGANNDVIRYFLFAQALADYRAGQFAVSHDGAQKCLQSNKGMSPYGIGMAKLISAMSQSRLGHNDQARSEWVDASQFCAAQPVADRGQLLFPGDWHDGIGMELLLREARQLFERRTPAETKKVVNDATNP